MAPADTDDSGGGIAERVVDLLVEVILPFPWAVGFLAGCGAFVLGYLILGGYYILGLMQLPGAASRKAIQIGYILYNSHTIPIVPTATEPLPPGQVLGVGKSSWIAQAADPAVYYAVPVVALFLASVAFTYWYYPEDREVSLAVMTGVSMMIGYLLVALLGTFLVTTAQQTHPPDNSNITAISYVLHPDRVKTIIYGLLYPLVVGFVGSLPVQAVLTNESAGFESEREERS